MASWSRLNDANDIADVVTGINAMPQIGFLTNPGDGVTAATNHLTANARINAEQIFCLSSDGASNSGVDLGGALAAARASSFVLDSFAVIGIVDPGQCDETCLRNEYASHVFGRGICKYRRLFVLPGRPGARRN